jgi:hypothetical protein
VSGFGETIIDFCEATTAATTFSACNGSYSANELCGFIDVMQQVQDSYELPWLFNGSAWHVATTVSLDAGFTRRLFSGASTSPGDVVLRVRASAGVTYKIGGSFLYFQIAGVSESSPFAINSLPASGSWLSGRSAVVSLSGGYFQLGSFYCKITPQDVTISFS